MMFDLIIHPNGGFLGAGDQLKTSYPPIQTRCDLGPHLWVGRVHQATANAVMDLCDSNCIGAPSPVRQYAQLYAFVREVSETDSLYRWDEDNRLKDCVALSRLVHPTATDFKYAARVRSEMDGGSAQICRGEITGIDIAAYLSPAELRDWLTESEAIELKDTLASLSTAQLPERVRNALFYHELAFRTWYADVRWTLVCTALEALLNNSPHQNKKQFCSRVPELAAELNLQFSDDEAKTAYEVRSKLAHGQAFLYGLPHGDLKIYDQMEAVLRACILRSIRDRSFAQIFASDQSIGSRWPL